MRPRKFLLVTKALTTAGLLAACKKEDLPPPPGNPKGMPANPKGSIYDAGAAPPPPPPSIDTTGIGPGPITPPGNPKGTMYDAGLRKPPPPGNPKGTKTPNKNPMNE